MVRVLLCYLYIFYINLLCSRSLFFVSFFYFITDKPLRHFLFDDRGKGKYSNKTKYVDVFLRLFQGFSVFFSPLSISLARLSGAVVLLWAYQLIIPGTVAFFWLVSSLFFWCFFFISFTFHTTFLLHHIHNIIVQMILYIAEGIHILK